VILNIPPSWGAEYYLRKTWVSNKQVQGQNESTQQLLRVCVPSSVIPQLLAGEMVVSQFEKVCILVSDLVGFTAFCSSHSVEEVVNMLSDLYTEFDKLCDKHSMYKVQTIGDAYVVVSGLPFFTEADDKPATHAVRLMNMAREMCSVTKQTGKRLGVALNMRIGMHYGNIVGGVIGTNKLRFDIWGVDVIAAHKLESSGTPGSVLASLSAYRLLKDSSFVFRRSPNDMVVAGQKKRVYLHDCDSLEDLREPMANDDLHEDDGLLFLSANVAMDSSESKPPAKPRAAFI
jgi:class 3 adenylate cyclase